MVKDPGDIVKVGQKVSVKILSISSTERHLGLSLKAGSSSESTSKPKLNKEELAEALDAAIDSEIK